jgi:hypothetical protein
MMEFILTVYLTGVVLNWICFILKYNKFKKYIDVMHKDDKAEYLKTHGFYDLVVIGVIFGYSSFSVLVLPGIIDDLFIKNEIE